MSGSEVGGDYSHYVPAVLWEEELELLRDALRDGAGTYSPELVRRLVATIDWQSHCLQALTKRVRVLEDQNGELNDEYDSLAAAASGAVAAMEEAENTLIGVWAQVEQLQTYYWAETAAAREYLARAEAAEERAAQAESLCRAVGLERDSWEQEARLQRERAYELESRLYEDHFVAVAVAVDWSESGAGSESDVGDVEDEERLSFIPLEEWVKLRESEK